MKKAWIIMVLLFGITSSAGAVYQFSGACIKKECPICGELITKWVESHIGPYMPSYRSDGFCITYCDESGICNRNPSQRFSIEIELCPKCFKLYGDTLKSAFSEKLREIQTENVGLRQKNQRINKEREKKQLQKQRDELMRQIEQIEENAK